MNKGVDFSGLRVLPDDTASIKLATRREKFAHHEAGHAVIAVSLGLPLEYVTIDIPESHSTLLAGLTKIGEMSDYDSKTKLIFFVSGILAEMKFRLNRFPPASFGVVLVEALESGDRDLSYIEDELTLMEMVNEDPPEGVLADALNMIERDFHVIKKVAARLQEAGTLTGEDVHEVVESCRPEGDQK